MSSPLDKIPKPLRPTVLTLILYIALLIVGNILTWISSAAGAWFTIAIILANVGYLQKISNATKRRTVNEFLPALATCALAFVLQQWQDYVWSLLSVTVLFARISDLYSRPATKKQSHRLGRRSGPSGRTGRSRSRSGL